MNKDAIVIPDHAEIEVYRADILRLAEEEQQNGLAANIPMGMGSTSVGW